MLRPNQIKVGSVILENVTDPGDPGQLAYNVYSVITSQSTDGPVYSAGSPLGTIRYAKDIGEQDSHPYLNTKDINSLITAEESKDIGAIMTFLYLKPVGPPVPANS